MLLNEVQKQRAAISTLTENRTHTRGNVQRRRQRSAN